MAACMADWWLPRHLFAQRIAAPRKPERRVIVVTFGGGVRYEDTLAPEGWVNIPHLASELVPQGLVYPVARHEGLTGHFNSTARWSPAQGRTSTPTGAKRP
jgi:predicted esterase